MYPRAMFDLQGMAALAFTNKYFSLLKYQKRHMMKKTDYTIKHICFRGIDH
jgi:hypothetical protein